MTKKMLWGGRFGAGPDADMLRLTASIGFDVELLEQDVDATRAHARVLAAAGFLERDEADAIDTVCDEVLEQWHGGSLEIRGDEDVHSLLERMLTERLGETGERIHAGRSRNDLVATDLRLWCKRSASDLAGLTAELVSTLCNRAAEHTATVMPGYTHVQRAQPVSLGFHLCAHGFALVRDIDRFETARVAADVSALGAGALAGTTLPLDPQIARSELGFSRIFDNAMDAVSDRDFACDLAYACALCGVHLSRFAEEIVLWSAAEFGFVELPDEWSTGSSMMPQKRNPDMAELVRGRAAGNIANLGGLLTLLKGLPLAYNRDLQEDKQHLFDTVERLAGCLRGMTGLTGAITFRQAELAAAAGGSGTWATDIAERLVARGVPFREAHAATGRLVADLEAAGVELADADAALVESHHPALSGADVDTADARTAVEARNGPGGPAPERVREQIAALRAASDGYRT